jgi:hypothetical protein
VDSHKDKVFFCVGFCFPNFQGKGGGGGLSCANFGYYRFYAPTGGKGTV